MNDEKPQTETTPDGAASVLSAGLGAWLPIETAPEGKRILVCVPIVKHRLVIAFKNDFGLFLDEQMQPMAYPPFWWMPLPPLPE
jgi:hypothetical protein